MKTQKFFIEGMTCTACSGGIERSLSRKDFVQEIHVNLTAKSATIIFDETKADMETIFAQIRKLGYTPFLRLDSKAPATSRRTLAIVALLTLAVLYLSMGAMLGLPQPLPLVANHTCQLLLTLVIMFLGRRFYTQGFASLFAGVPNMESLIALSTSASFLYSLTLFGSAHLYFESIAVILCLVLLGKSIEERAKADAQSGLAALLSEQPKEAICLRDGIEEKIATDAIAAGNLLRILPGSRIPVDGIVFDGIANVDESMLTGEVLPVGKKQGEKLYAGSLNTNTSFIMQASGTSAQSSLQAIVALIEQAALSKTKLTQIADKIAAIFVPTIIAIAVVAGVVWTFLSDFATGFEIAVSVLVVSCPCALGLATPMSVLIGGSLASARALFFKSAQTMEDTRTIDSVLFDKTGTLTNKTLEIVQIVPMSCGEDELLALMASIEQTSEHLIAQAIVHTAKERGLALHDVATSHSEAGYGITARIDERDYRLGNAAFVGATDEATKDDAAGIVVYLAREGEILGKIVLFDNLKEGATELVGWLKAQGIGVQILSGDSEHNVRKIAEQLGDVAYTAAAKPADKLRVVQSLKEQGKHVMMVGDGVNDAAALAASTASVSFVGASDVSYQSADVIICNDDIRSVGYAIALGKAIARNIKQNLFWAFCYNGLSIPIACGILLPFGIGFNPMLAAAAMCLSSLSVVANAQRLRRFQFKI